MKNFNRENTYKIVLCDDNWNPVFPNKNNNPYFKFNYDGTIKLFNMIAMQNGKEFARKSYKDLKYGEPFSDIFFIGLVKDEESFYMGMPYIENALTEKGNYWVNYCLTKNQNGDYSESDIYIHIIIV